jgi:myo-inositol-1(or 4)-monophosphatase
MTLPNDLHALSAAVESMARTAGEIQMRHFRKLKGYEKKGAIDLLTIADKESEAAIISEIRRLFPGHAILAEEGGRHEGTPGSEYLWIIDPLDGTTNFAHGVPFFAVSIAVQYHGRTVAGAVHAPYLGDLYLATRGEGATLNGEPIRVSRVDRLADALLVTGFPYNRAEIVDHLMECFRHFLLSGQGMLRLGAASLDLALIASGNIEAMYELNLHAWDMAAGQLLIEEAGGRLSRYDGSPLDLFGREMVASNGLVHEEMLAGLAKFGR